MTNKFFFGKDYHRYFSLRITYHATDNPSDRLTHHHGQYLIKIIINLDSLLSHL